MAEDKKIFFTESDKKTTEQIVSVLFLLLLFGALLAALLGYLENMNLGFLQGIWNYFLEHIWPIWKIIAALLCLLAIAGIIHNTWKLQAINNEENQFFDPEPVAIGSDKEKVVEVKNKKWEQVLKYMNSGSASDWRLAIIEADVILEELLRAGGHLGESDAERL